MKFVPTLAGFLLLFALPACRPMLYPAARAFGSPSEDELKRCRVAFEQFKARPAQAQIVVHEVVDPRGSGATRHLQAAGCLAASFQAQGLANVSPAAFRPEVDPTPLGRNQLRYTWRRAHAYGDWIERMRPEGDYFVFVEMLPRPSGEIVGIQTYILDRTGAVAYARLLNSHHFGRPALKDSQEGITFLLQVLQKDLVRRGTELFPPYGVG
jgi:hypothetical protein